MDGGTKSCQLSIKQTKKHSVDKLEKADRLYTYMKTNKNWLFVALLAVIGICLVKDEPWFQNIVFKVKNFFKQTINDFKH